MSTRPGTDVDPTCSIRITLSPLSVQNTSWSRMAMIVASSCAWSRYSGATRQSSRALTRGGKRPANGIPQGCGSITPEMLPLVELSQAEIDRIVAGVPGGAANVQDIYPLAPLQEGILFHHLLSQEGDPYLTPSVTEFDTRARLEQHLAALQAVIDRHDILRTAVAWEGLREPVQVVWRQAPLPVEEVELDAEAGDAAEQLWRRYDPRHYRMDLTRAPLRRACIAEDRARGRWLLLMLTHHLTSDHESLEVQREEISAHLRGLESELPAPLPFRNYVAQARLGVSREEHERFFRGMLGDVEEPTAPYGLLDVWGEGRGIEEARLPVAGELGARLRRRARALGVSAASLFHLAWAQVLARLSGRADVVFGTLLFGRMQGGEGADRVMGPFINTLPVRIGVGEEGVEAAVRRTHALLADLLRHEHASLALAQRCSGVAAPAPLFTSLLNYRHGGARGPSQTQQAVQRASSAAAIAAVAGRDSLSPGLRSSCPPRSSATWSCARCRRRPRPDRVLAHPVRSGREDRRSVREARCFYVRSHRERHQERRSPRDRASGVPGRSYV